MSYDKEVKKNYDQGPQKVKEPFTWNPVTIINRFIKIIMDHHKRAFGAAWDSFLEGLNLKDTKEYSQRTYRNREEQMLEDVRTGKLKIDRLNPRPRVKPAPSRKKQKKQKKSKRFQDMSSDELNDLINRSFQR